MFTFLFIVKLKSLRVSGLIEVFEILRTDYLQLLYTCLAVYIYLIYLSQEILLVSVGG